MTIPDKINDPVGYVKWYCDAVRIHKVIEQVSSMKLNGSYSRAMEIILNYYRHPESFGIFGEASIKEIAEPYIISRRELDQTGGSDLVFSGRNDGGVGGRYEYVRDCDEYIVGKGAGGIDINGAPFRKSYMTSHEICDDLLECTDRDSYPFVDMMGETICGGVMFYPALIDILFKLMFFEQEFDPFEWMEWLIYNDDWRNYGCARGTKWAVVKVRWVVTVDNLDGFPVLR